MARDNSYFKQRYEDLFDNEKADEYIFKGNGYSFTLKSLKTLYRNKLIPIKVIAGALNISVSGLMDILKTYQLYSPNRRFNLCGESLIYLSDNLNMPYNLLRDQSDLYPIKELSTKLGVNENDLELLLKCLKLIKEIPVDEIKTCGEYLTTSYVSESGQKKWRRHHRKIMEDHLGRKLKGYEKVHHINGDKENNSIGNLYIANGESEHAQIHNSLDKLAYELVDLGIIKFKNGEYFLEEGFYDDVERFNYKKGIFNKNLEYYRGEQLKYDDVEDL